MPVKPVPVYILSGFLGSGKTTLLSKAIHYMQEQGKRPAVIMNELGDVNLDGLIVGAAVPMAEMLGGCICCTVRGDLGAEIRELVREHDPDVLFIEATGVANPMEILDGVTEASLVMRMELKSVVTVVDARQLKEQLDKAAGKTFRLVQEQIRCASVVVLNKADLAETDELTALGDTIRRWNPYAPVIAAVQAGVDMALFDGDGAGAPACGCGHVRHEHSRTGGHAEGGGDCCGHHAGGHHRSHDHVMVYTHYLRRPVDSSAFEALIGALPENVYRAKGVLSFTDTARRYLFQYAFRQVDFMPIAPQGEVPDVVVFIGEQFSKRELQAALERLENGQDG